MHEPFDLDSDWVQERTAAINEHCKKLAVAIGKAVRDGDSDVAMRHAAELARIAALLAGRAYVLQETARLVVADPDVARVLEKFLEEKLPTE